jgi:hypothetical protein
MSRYGWQLAVALCALLVGIVLGAAVAATPDPGPAPLPVPGTPGPPAPPVTPHGYLHHPH